MISSGMRPTKSPGSACHAAHLLERALASRRSLLLLANARLVVVLAALELAQNAGLLALLLEPLHRDFERLVVAHLDHGHSERSPLHAGATPRTAVLARVRRSTSHCCGRLTVRCVEFASPLAVPEPGSGEGKTP